MKKILLGVLVVAVLLGISVGIAGATSTGTKGAVGLKETSLTIYNGFALVREVYEVRLNKGKNEIWFGDFPDQVDPSSIRIKSLNAPNDLVVLEQSFDKNRITPSLWIIGLPFSKSFIALVKTKYPYNITPQLIELSYFVKGISWQTIYRLEVAKNIFTESIFKLSSWIVITNQSGNKIVYKNAKIKLVAGDIHQVNRVIQPLGEGKAPSGQFEEKTFFEYHTYTLDKSLTLKHNETKLIPLFQMNWINTGMKFIFEGQRSNKVQIRPSFLNGEDNGLGMSLPAGVVQVFKEDADGQLEFIGEDRISHTPKDEMIELYLGNTFDIIGERKILERKQVDAQTWQETVKITLKNHKNEDVVVTVIEHLYGDWEILDVIIKRGTGAPQPLIDLDKNLPQDFKKKDAQTIEFKPLVVPRNGQIVIIYRVRYKR